MVLYKFYYLLLLIITNQYTSWRETREIAIPYFSERQNTAPQLLGNTEGWIKGKAKKGREGQRY